MCLAPPPTMPTYPPPNCAASQLQLHGTGAAFVGRSAAPANVVPSTKLVVASKNLIMRSSLIFEATKAVAARCPPESESHEGSIIRPPQGRACNPWATLETFTAMRENDR